MICTDSPTKHDHSTKPVGLSSTKYRVQRERAPRPELEKVETAARFVVNIGTPQNLFGAVLNDIQTLRAPAC
jgi:hypothetical protein